MKAGFDQPDGMNWARSLATLVCILLFVLGCAERENKAVAADLPQLPTEAQPRLTTTNLWIGFNRDLSATITAEIARSEKEIMTGMMFRTNVVQSDGMLFVFPTPRRTGFWMKNCPTPLSCAYISPDGTIQEIHDMEPYNTNSIMALSGNIMFVLETSQGWFERNDVAVGMQVHTEEGSLVETFFKPRTR